ncbi:hypothetical protein B0F90DRAFT_1342241 [Multifurca ochricompacta]|uniref:Uncharacterized protein n=1 Tax=Multifurca ochricompacta TaxID=376703 RepID=A0AAD4QJ60_9AGAM|nr:hypothetical protein B0F90DRAFT_1342241 [Multifurca ochricompacta]
MGRCILRRFAYLFEASMSLPAPSGSCRNLERPHGPLNFQVATGLSQTRNSDRHPLQINYITEREPDCDVLVHDNNVVWTGGILDRIATETALARCSYLAHRSKKNRSWIKQWKFANYTYEFLLRVHAEDLDPLSATITIVCLGCHSLKLKTRVYATLGKVSS